MALLANHRMAWCRFLAVPCQLTGETYSRSPTISSPKHHTVGRDRLWWYDLETGRRRGGSGSGPTVDLLSDVSPAMRSKIVVHGEPVVGKSALISVLLDELTSCFEGKSITKDVDRGVSAFEFARPASTAAASSSSSAAAAAAETVDAFGFWEDTYNVVTERLRPLIYPQSDIHLVCLPLDGLRKDPSVVLELLGTQIEKTKFMQREHNTRSAMIFIVGCRKDLTDIVDDGAGPCRSFGPRPIQLGRHLAHGCRSWRLDRFARGLQPSVDGYFE